MRLTRLYIIVIAFAFGTSLVNAQDAQFSQYYASQLNLSPSFAGAAGGLRGILNHRLQWLGIDNNFGTAFNTSSLAFDYYIPDYNSGVGIIANRTSAGNGFLTKSKYGGLYSFNVKVIRDWYFRPGIEFSYNSIQYDISQFTFGDQIIKESRGQLGNVYYTDENFGEFLDNTGYLDIGASALVYSKMYWGGLTMSHLMQPTESIRQDGASDNTVVPIKYLAYAGAKIDINQRIGRADEESLFASFLYRSQGEFDQFDIGAYWLRTPLIVGIWYRGLPGLKSTPDNSVSHDALTLLVGLKQKDLGISFSYDVTISNLVLDSGGAYELAINYFFFESLKRKPKRILVPCPRF